MKALILETVKQPAETLQEKIHSIDDKIEILDTLSTTGQAIHYFRHNPQPDLLFLEIDAENSINFNLFVSVEVACPVVFILDAGLDYSDAQLHNCIDILIKPLDPYSLKKCLEHYRELQHFFIKNHSSLYEHLNGKEKLKSRILIKKGTEFQTFKISDVVYFFSDHKLVFLVDKENRKYLTTARSLSELFSQLDRNTFYRANRKFIVNVEFIQVFSIAHSSRIRLKLILPMNEPILISQQNTSFFKQWIGEKL